MRRFLGVTLVSAMALVLSPVQALEQPGRGGSAVERFGDRLQTALNSGSSSALDTLASVELQPVLAKTGCSSTLASVSSAEELPLFNAVCRRSPKRSTALPPRPGCSRAWTGDNTNAMADTSVTPRKRRTGQTSITQLN